MILEILQNAALLSVTTLGLFWVFQRALLEQGISGSVAIGFVYGVVGFLVTATPIHFEDGATIDARAGPVLVAGILGGPIAGVIAAVGGAFSRYLVGGTFAFSGVIVFFLYAMVGASVWRKWLIRSLGGELSLARVSAAATLSIAAASLMFFLIQPRERAWAWLSNDLPWIAVANVTSVLLTTAFAVVSIAYARQRHSLQEAAHTIALAKEVGGIGVWTYDPSRDTAYWDDENKNLHGLRIKGNFGRYSDWEVVVHPEDLGRVKAEFQATLDNQIPFDTQYRIIQGDGSVRTLKGIATVEETSIGDLKRIVGVNFDLTPLIEKDAELDEARSVASQAQKMEAIGQLTGGVAHDFNNLLAVILGNIELIEDTDDPTEIKGFLEAAKSATHRGADLTKSLLSFARQASLEPALIDLNQMVKETKGWSSRVIPENIDVEISLLAGLWRAEVDPTLTQNALLNLILNARDAMPQGGKMTIETSNVRIDDEYNELRGEDVEPGRYVMLAVSDTGEGISKANIDHIFEPFFTTKPVGTSSGLGLSMVQGFLKQSNGTVRVYSEEGIGTTFKLYFKAATGQQYEPSRQKTEAQESAEGPARILVVEDEEPVLDVLKANLAKAGYQVTSARSGDEALQMWSDDSPFELLVTDIVMPGDLQGTQLARALRDRCPELRVVFMSGYASEATVHGNGLRPEDIRLMKPVQRVDLIAAVEKALRPRTVSY